MVEMTEEHKEVLKVSWGTFDHLTHILAAHILQHPDLDMATHEGIIAVSRGGLIPATLLSHTLKVPIKAFHMQDYITWVRQSNKAYLVVDDICDTGKTFREIKEFLPNSKFVSVYVKPEGLPYRDASAWEVPQDTWVQFPWETE